LKRLKVLCVLLVAISLLHINPSAAPALPFADLVGDTFDRRGLPVATDPYVDMVEVEVSQLGADYSARVKMNGPLPHSLSDPSIFIEWAILVDIDQNPATRNWGPWTLMDNGIGVDGLVRLTLGPRGADYRADIYDPAKRKGWPIEFKIDGSTVILKYNSSYVAIPRVFDYVFVVRIFGEYGRGGAERACDKVPNQGYFTFSEGKAALRGFTTTADERFNAAVEIVDLINRYLRDPATGAYYADAKQDWTTPTVPTLYAQIRMISVLLELYLATKSEEYLTYAKGARSFMEKQLRTIRGAYQASPTDSSIDVFVNAQSALALMKMYETTGDGEAMKRAREVADFIVTYMSDKTNGGFFNYVWENGTRRENTATWYQATTVLMLATLYPITKNTTYLEYAEKTQALIDKYMWVEGFGYWSYPSGNWTRRLWESDVFTFFRQAWSVKALLALYVATGKMEYIERARKTADAAESYWNLGYSCHDVIFSNGTRAIPWREIYFAYEVEALTELAKATGEDVYLRYARRSLDQYITALADKTYGGFVMARSRIDSKRGTFLKSAVYQSKVVESILLYGYEVPIAVTGLPKTLRAKISIDGKSLGTIQGEETKLAVMKFGPPHEIKAEEIIPGTEGARYSCAANARSVSSEGAQSFEYKLQYFLTVKSEHGSTSGEGWYNAGSTASFSVSPTSIGFGVQQVFKGWSGDSKATAPTSTIEMNGPRRVVAVWSTDYTQVLAIALAVVAVAAAGAFLLLKQRKKT